MPALLDPSLRREYLARLRRDIEDGTYETPEKLERALDAFLNSSATSAVQPRGASRPQ